MFQSVYTLQNEKESLEDVSRRSTVHGMFLSSGERLITFSETVTYYIPIKRINLHSDFISYCNKLTTAD